MAKTKRTAVKAVEPDTNNKVPSLLSGIGLFGLSQLEPVIVAALATEEPLLLIGPHGTGKSLLLTRIAEALDLDFRHYNASLLNFDDLVGFPLPGKDGSLEYVRTPAAIWGAGAVIFDEISRCRPDIQNKLFPIVHERRAQGMLLEGLRYRWAAMNPPLTDEDDDGYIGSEPLDPALADRFAYVVDMPSWKNLQQEDQTAIIVSENAPLVRSGDRALVKALSSTKATLPSVKGCMADGIAIYVRTLVALLAQAGIGLSPRRAGILFRSILAVHAASLALDPSACPSDSALLAVQNGLPQRAQGIKVPSTKLLLAHKEAWRLVDVKQNDPILVITTEPDPIERVRLAVGARRLRKGDISGIVADALASIPTGAKEAVAVHLFETDTVGRLTAAVAEQVAHIYRNVATPPKFSESISGSSPRSRTWQRIRDILSRLDPNKPRAHLAANALAYGFASEQVTHPEDADRAYEAWLSADAILAGGVA
jgi:MoxR-like ATPase